MAQQYEKLEVFERTLNGTKAAKALRRESRVPAVYYYKGQENINLSMDRVALMRSLHTGHHIFEIEIDGKEQYAMVKAVQYHPVTDEIIHLDLLRVRRDQKITITVPLVLVGDSAGSHQGGMVIQSLNTVDVSCLPIDVPEKIELDITNLELNNSYTVEDIVTEENIEIVSQSDLVVVSVQIPKEETVVEEVEEVEGEDIDADEAPAEGEEPAEETTENE